MATSGSTNYTQTRNEVISDAFQLLGVYGIGRTVSSEDMAFANSILNKMIKAWQGKGLHLWAKEEATLFLTKSTASYSLGTGGTARATLESDAVITELNGSHAASATTLTVDSTSGMSASDVIGVVLTDDTIHYTTIVSVDSSTGLTITSGLASAASDNGNVYTYTTVLGKPLRVLAARRCQGVGASETQIPMLMLSHEEYFDLPTKATDGSPTHYHYDPDLNGGTFYVWPRPNDPEVYIRFTFERELEDLDAAGDNFDLPNEWLEAITYQLAVRMAPAFGKDAKLQVLAPMAGAMLQEALEWDTEIGSLTLIPDME